MKKHNKKQGSRKVLPVVLFVLLLLPNFVVVIAPNYGYALSFDGVNDYVQFSNQTYSSSDFPYGITLELWVYLRSYDEVNNKFVECPSFLINIVAADYKVYFSVYNGSQPGMANTDNVMQIERWYHYVGTWNRTSEDVLLYENTVLQATTGTSNNATIDVERYTWFGRGGNLGLQYCNCVVDEIRIYGRPITQQEITYSYNEGIGRHTPSNTSNLVGWWHLNEGTGTIVDDESNVPGDGTINDDEGDQWVTGHVPIPSQVNPHLTESATTIFSLFSVNIILSVFFVIKMKPKTIKGAFSLTIGLVVTLTVIMSFYLFFDVIGA